MPGSYAGTPGGGHGDAGRGRRHLQRQCHETGAGARRHHRAQHRAAPGCAVRRWRSGTTRACHSRAWANSPRLLGRKCCPLTAQNRRLLAGGGGRMVRAAGTSATLLAKQDNGYALLRMPSGEQRMVCSSRRRAAATEPAPRLPLRIHPWASGCLEAHACAMRPTVGCAVADSPGVLRHNRHCGQQGA